MEAFKGREYIKIQHLKSFYGTGLVIDGWSMDNVGEGDERYLLQNFYKCVSVFKKLSLTSQEVIADITKRMGEGMAKFVERDLGQGTLTLEDYNLYCHYVAGLVGEGLSRLFHSTGYESAAVGAAATTLANTMGLFLQKTNIIRDYLEDLVDGRAFWPKEIWCVLKIFAAHFSHHAVIMGSFRKLYAADDLGELAESSSRVRAVHCLNHLITDALRCVPECLAYMDLLRKEEVFRFCAIPQVMAITTLAELYNNPKVFTG